MVVGAEDATMLIIKQLSQSSIYSQKERNSDHKPRPRILLHSILRLRLRDEIGPPNRVSHRGQRGQLGQMGRIHCIHATMEFPDTIRPLQF